MAKYRPLYTKIWKDPDFQELSPENKLIFIYLCTNELTTESGIYPMTPKTIADETAVEREKVTKLLQNGNLKNVKYDTDNRLIFIKNFHKYNSGGKPELIKRSIINDCTAYPQTALWTLFIENYPEFETEVKTVCKRFGNSLETVVAESALILISTKSQSQSQSQSQKMVADSKNQTFEQYQVELKKEYSDLDFDNEFKKFNLYWSEGKRKLQRPKLALKNWLEKARQIKQEHSGNGANRQDNKQGVPGNRAAGAFDDIGT